ncbi:hypothetical protein QJS10_CPB04g01696 [Acorus calamus]|uniref:F-box protein n=1 Tax=Acorus calamus TaxID=4465 RepID=A0AAV9F0J3_ACOCL|nr:hypothetical protein QJS10_CPB04g01696 [Acorus calamus]
MPVPDFDFTSDGKMGVAMALFGDGRLIFIVYHKPLTRFWFWDPESCSWTAEVEILAGGGVDYFVPVASLSVRHRNMLCSYDLSEKTHTVLFDDLPYNFDIHPYMPNARPVVGKACFAATRVVESADAPKESDIIYKWRTGDIRYEIQCSGAGPFRSWSPGNTTKMGYTE